MNSPRFHSGHLQRRLCLLTLIVGAGVLAERAAAASASGAVAGDERVSVLVAADETRLWLAGVSADRSTLFLRQSAGRFNLGQSINAPVALLTAHGANAALVFRDGQLYAADAQQRPVVKLPTPPGFGAPLDLVSSGDELLALVRQPQSASRPAGDESADGLADPTEQALTVLRLEKDGWKALVDCPREARRREAGAASPRLLAGGDVLALVYEPVDQPGRLVTLRFDSDAQRWDVLAAELDLPNLARFWLTSVANVATLAAVQRDRAGNEQLVAYRLLGNLTAGRSDWQPATLHLSDLPEPTQASRVHGVFGFNQHLGMVVDDADDAAYLRFARFDGPALERTIAVADVFQRPGALQQMQQLTQMASFIVLLLLLTGLFTLRRDSMRAITSLPAGRALAFSFQRLAGWLVDFAPILLVTAAWMDVDWRSGLSTLSGWAISPRPEQDGPQRNVLLWWACSVVVYTAYSLLAELLAARTLGKLLLRCAVCDERGGRPAAWQILVRNLFRLLELAPQFWVFQLLLVLSPNRQRLGDIFARTLILRNVPHDSNSRPAEGQSPGDGPPGA